MTNAYKTVDAAHEEKVVEAAKFIKLFCESRDSCFDCPLGNSSVCNTTEPRWWDITERSGNKND